MVPAVSILVVNVSATLLRIVSYRNVS